MKSYIITLKKKRGKWREEKEQKAEESQETWKKEHKYNYDPDSFCH